MKKTSIAAIGMVAIVAITLGLIASDTTAQAPEAATATRHKVITTREINAIYNAAGADTVQGGSDAVARRLDQLSAQGWELFQVGEGYLFFRSTK
jgi:hypothetical protein